MKMEVAMPVFELGTIGKSDEELLSIYYYRDELL
jgi:hypothetical protein